MLYFLHMRASECGISTPGVESVKQTYDDLAAAKAQAEHDIKNNTRTPLRIVDENDQILVNYEE